MNNTLFKLKIQRNWTEVIRLNLFNNTKKINFIN
jgi:hypothetical protein